MPKRLIAIGTRLGKRRVWRVISTTPAEQSCATSHELEYIESLLRLSQDMSLIQFSSDMTLLVKTIYPVAWKN